MKKAESELYEMFKIENETAAWKRFFSSDLITHHNEIMNYKKRQNTDFSISLTEQPPASNIKVAMFDLR